MTTCESQKAHIYGHEGKCVFCGATTVKKSALYFAIAWAERRRDFCWSVDLDAEADHLDELLGAALELQLYKVDTKLMEDEK